MAALLALYLVSPWICYGLGQLLVNDQPPERADAALVLAGDQLGNRILKGADLVRQGYVPKAYISGPKGYFGYSEDELAIRFAVEQKGQPREWFEGLPSDAASTVEEARVLLPVLRARGVHKLLLVTSTFHTARAARVFRRTDPAMQIVVVAASEPNFPLDRWWRFRQGQKYFFFEVTKTIADWIGL